MAQPISDVAADYILNVTDQNPTPDKVQELVDYWSKKPEQYKKAMAMLKSLANTKKLKPGSPEAIAKFTKQPKQPTQPATTAAKGPTFAAQLKVIAKPFGVVKAVGGYDDDNDPMNDPEIGNAYAAIKQELKKKYNPKNNGSWSANGKKVSSMMKAIRNTLSTAQDKNGFLKAVLHSINPNAKFYQIGQKVNPGEFHGLPVPTDQLSAFAKQHIPAPDKQAKALALAQKIQEYEDLIAKLKSEQNKALSAKQKAEHEKDKLGGMDPKLLQYFSYIEKNCSDYLKAVKASGGQLLYRGQDDASQPFFVAYPRGDREPKDSDPKAQKMLDDYLKLCGFKALRSNSIFTSADFDQASNYGDVFAIFPKNGFSFTWSTRHDDLVIHSPQELGLGGSEDEAEDAYYDHEDWISSMSSFCENTFDWIHDNAKALKINTKDDTAVDKLEKLIHKTPEVKALSKAIDHYQALDTYDDDAKKFHERFDTLMKAYSTMRAKTPYRVFNDKEELRLQKVWQKSKDYLAPQKAPASASKAKAMEVIKKQGFKNDDLPAALKSHHEICVLGEYIAVNYDTYEDAIDNYFIKPHKVSKKKKP